MNRLLLSTNSSFASPYSLSVRKREGKEPAAEIQVQIPSGKSTRLVTIDVSADDLILLAEKALEAYRVLSQN